MTKKNEFSDYTDMKTRTDILVYDLDGKAHTFYPKNVYSISTLEAGKRYLVEYMKGGTKHEVQIRKKTVQHDKIYNNANQRNINLMIKETVEVKDNVITLQDMENKKHAFHIDDIFSITLLPMDNKINPCSVKYLSLEEDKDIGCKTLEIAIITKKQFDALKDILDKTRYKQ